MQPPSTTCYEEADEKMIRRHPHVSGGVEVSGPDEVVHNLEAIKAEEKGRGEGRRAREPGTAHSSRQPLRAR
jgi:uncharacterized protein YabN with tetrapyrrole methylase and pyrophosphatase domain